MHPRALSVAFWLASFLFCGIATATDLHVTLEVDPSPASVGQEVVFVATAHNTSTAGGGPLDSPNVVLTAQLPAGVEISEIDDGGFGFCSINGTTVTCEIPFMPAFSTFEVAIYAFLSSEGTATASATVAGPLFDPVPSNNAIETVFSVYGTALQLSKGAPEWVMVDGTLSFTIDVLNVGPNTATNVRVQDVVSAVFAVASASSDRGTCAVDGQTVTCAIGTLEAGASARVTIAAVGMSPHQGRENTATADADNAPGASATITVAVLEPEADADGDGISNGDELLAGSDLLEADYTDLVTEKTGPARAYVNEEIEYQITVTNQGNPDGTDAAVENAEVSDAIPVGMTFLGASPGCTYDEAARMVDCDLGPLAEGESKTVTVRVRVDATGGTELINSAIALAPGLFDTDNLSNASSAITDVIAALSDLSVTKSGPDTLVAGSTATYTLTVSNAGPDEATDVTMTDALPDGLSFQGEGSDSRCSASGQSVTCEVGTVGVGESVALQLLVAVSDAVEDGARITNSAHVQVSPEAQDPSSVNDDDSFSATVSNPPAPCKAYVLIGDFNGTPGSGFTGRFALWAALEAKSDYENAGYMVVFIDSARTFHLAQALADPETKAIWFLGHGAYEKDLRIALLNKWFGTPEPGLGFHNGYFEPHHLRGATYPNIEQVTIHACSQDLQEWQDAFPTAVENGEFDAWDSPTRGPDIYLWQRAATYPKCSTSDESSSNKMLAATPVSAETPATLHPRLWQEDAIYDKDSLFVLDLGRVTNHEGSFVLDDPLAAKMEGVAFNLIAFSDSIPATFVYAATVEDGRIRPENLSGEAAAGAAFDLHIRVSAYDSLLADPDAWPEISARGSVKVMNLQSGDVTEAEIVDAVGTLLWGHPYRETDLRLGAGQIVPAGPAGQLYLTIEVENRGPEPVRNAEIRLLIPEGASVSDSEPSCQPHPRLDVYVCQTGPMVPGERIEAGITMTTTAEPGTELEALIAVAAPGYGETEGADNHATVISRVGVAHEEEPPVRGLALHENYPDPFSARTTIRFDLPRPAHVSLRVHDVLGREIVRLAEGLRASGSHETAFEAADLPSGLYFLVLESNGRRLVRRMVIVR